MIGFQRVLSLLMATVMVCVFLVPLSFQRHQVKLGLLILALFFAYLAFNAYVFVRTRRTPKE